MLNTKFLVILLFFASLLKAQPLPSKDRVLMEVVLKSLKYYHYAPELVDDNFSHKVFDLYMKRLDNNKRFFLAKDIVAFKKYRFKLDNAALRGDFSFLDRVNTIRQERFAQIKTYCTALLSQPFEFTKDEKLETQGDKLEYANTEAELKERWRKYLKYQVLSRVQSEQTRQKAAVEKQDTAVKMETLDTIEKNSRARVLKSFNNLTKNFEQEDRDDRIALYLNVFTNVHEPHTGYFPPLEKENFNIRMSGKLEGIGAQLRQEDGFIKVAKIIPGSASYLQGELEVNDKIVKVAQADGEAVDVVDMKMDDVLPMIRGKKGSEVRLTVQKVDGTEKVIPIIRDVVVLEESYAKSAILERKAGKSKIGLIDLRSFYADFQDPKGRRCSQDVKQEVQKLIAEGVDGIIIDLRFNGGGSLSDVVDMTGLFIDKGPVVQVKGRKGHPLLLEDRDKSVLYDGPLVLLVNSFSASASEIMAAALQDYGRAVVIGTAPTTFGKGTVQRFFSLDDAIPQRLKKFGKLGSVKITIQKFYRINGASTQLKGVTPDIVLPGIYSYSKVGERDEDYPLKWTEIDPANYSEANKLPNLRRIKKRSARRVANNETFKLIEENALWLKEQQESSIRSLNLATYTAEKEKAEAMSKKFKAISKEIQDLNIRSLAVNETALAADEGKKESVENWHKKLKKDVYLEEAIFVIQDWK